MDHLTKARAMTDETISCRESLRLRKTEHGSTPSVADSRTLPRNKSGARSLELPERR